MSKVLCRRELVDNYKALQELSSGANNDATTSLAGHHSMAEYMGENYRYEGDEDPEEEYTLGNVHNKESERVNLSNYFLHTIRHGVKREDFEKDPIQVQYHVLHTPPEVKVLKNIISKPHPVVSCYCTAYSEHYPLVISPDHIWMMISQGLVRHLHLNPQQLMDHPIKKKTDIRVEMAKYSKNNNNDISVESIEWSAVIENIHQQIIENYSSTTSNNTRTPNDDEKSKDLIGFLDHNFSTTTPVEKVASKILLMEAFKDYFTYTNDFMCGLPCVTILGTMEDWTSMREKLFSLDSYGMKWWRKALVLILNKIIETAQKESLTSELKLFWNGVARFDSSSGENFITGWINYFFPYDKQGNISHQLREFREMDEKFNDDEKYIDDFEEHCSEFAEDMDEDGTLDGNDDDYSIRVNKSSLSQAMQKTFKWKAYFNVDSFPCPLAITTVNVENHPSINELYYISGFMGIDYDHQIGGLYPVISWAIAQKRSEAVRENLMKGQFEHAMWAIDCGYTSWRASISLSSTQTKPIEAVEIGFTSDGEQENVFESKERMIEIFTQLQESLRRQFIEEEINLGSNKLTFLHGKHVLLMAPSEVNQESLLQCAKTAGLKPICWVEDPCHNIPQAFSHLVKTNECVLTIDWPTGEPFFAISKKEYWNEFDLFASSVEGRKETKDPLGGGFNFTDMLYTYLYDQHPELAEENSHLLMMECERAKKMLSTMDKVDIVIKGSIVETVTREKFEQVCSPIFNSFQNQLSAFLSRPFNSDTSETMKDRVNYLTLSGGCCRIPLVQRIILSCLPSTVQTLNSMDDSLFLSSAGGAQTFRSCHYHSIQFEDFSTRHNSNEILLDNESSLYLHNDPHDVDVSTVDDQEIE